MTSNGWVYNTTSASWWRWKPLDGNTQPMIWFWPTFDGQGMIGDPRW